MGEELHEAKKPITEFEKKEEKHKSIEQTDTRPKPVSDIQVIKEIAIGLGFKEKKDKPGLFLRPVDQNAIAAVDFRKSDKGARYAYEDNHTVNEEKLKSDPRFAVLQRFKELRDDEDKAMQFLASVPKERQAVQKSQVSDLSLRGDYYRISGKREPDVWLVQQWFNREQGSLRVVDKDQTQQYAYATVRAILYGRFVEETVWHDFTTMRDLMLLDLVDKEKQGTKIIDGFDDDGRPVLTEEGKRRFLRRFVQFKVFALRDAISKAGRRAMLKIMNSEWRGVEELELEQNERKLVAGEEKEESSPSL